MGTKACATVDTHSLVVTCHYSSHRAADDWTTRQRSFGSADTAKISNSF